MSQPPYGQQPGNYGQSGGYPQQPSGGYPQAPGYPTSPPGGFPQQSGGYPQAPGYASAPGGLPQAPPDYGQGGPVGRPGSATAAAVLGFVQAGITTLTTLLLFLGLAQVGDVADTSGVAIAWAIALGQLAGIVLLIWGGVQLMSGAGRALFLAGAALEIVLSLVWLIRFAAAETAGFSLAENVQSFGVFMAIIFAIMPVIGLILAMGGATTQYVQSRRA
ncbi:MAG TPA: hypothetical protein VFV67_00330 [Actinophytocola sp.]|uniref:hypothetical protein n=1 Tax=Actinophytocola sp. TaxID=1872138 RepID=UPI002DBC5166|nr:hypothetical protein [Actinophytocola sp.]HEU5469069.1 hypothetical protein [Actinophytocola sp.]